MSAVAQRVVAWRRPVVSPYAPLAVLLAAGGVTALSAAGTPNLLVPAERGHHAGWVTGPLAGLGVHVGPHAFAAEVLAMALAYAVILALGTQLELRHLLLGVGGLFAMFLLAPPLLSTDVFNYIDYGRLGIVHHVSPYAFPPTWAPHDPIYRFARWHHAASVYGPLFTLGSYAVAALGPAAALWAFKALAAAAGLACVGLVARIAARLGRSPTVAAAVVGLNPVFVVWTVGGAHNDLLMLAALLAAVLLVLEHRPVWAGGALVAAAAIKATAGLALPFLLVRPEGRRQLLAGAGSAAVLVGLLSFAAFPDHAGGLLSALWETRRHIAGNSVPTEVAGLLGLTLNAHVRLALTVGFLGTATALALYAWRRGGDWIGALGWTLLAFVASSTWILPWYTIWPLVLAAVVRDRRLLAATLLLQTFLIVNELALYRA
jgi:alpha-1,6-mannosyltransferase